ncbi:MAG: hypothetical protein Fur005_34850 [Roseiflexaceae bacterium]
MRQYARLGLALLLGVGFLAIYLRTAAPGLLSGDPAEFQLVAVILGVAHPTTYPLYTLLGHVAVRLLPIGELAWRVTVVSAVCAAGAVALAGVLALRLGRSWWAALFGAALLGVSPGLWNAATLAEVYALLALLMLLALIVLEWANQQPNQWRMGMVGLLAGLGFSHHGLFAISILPVLLTWVAWQIWQQPQRLWLLLSFAIGGLIGLSPWVYPFIQYARYGPFAGEDYGLPRHYFWGAPDSFQAVADLLLGGSVRRGIFRLPTMDDALATFTMLRERTLFEIGWVGLLLVIIGVVVSVRCQRAMALIGAWIMLATISYLVLLGPAVADAPIFTLPMLIPLAIWCGVGIDQLLGWARRLPKQAGVVIVLVVLAAWMGWWTDTRIEHASKRHLTLYRSFAEAVLAELPPNAVVLAHWEQGMTLQYLRLVEQQRPDVWIDVVEPSDDPWGARAERRYADRPVFLIGQASDVAGLPVELVREDDYALLFRLRC